MPFRPSNSRYWHYDFQIRGCRFHGSCGTEDYEQAKAVEAQARVAAGSDAPEQAAGFTLSQAIGTYYVDISQHQPSARTSWSQGKAVLAVLDPQTRLDTLTQADVQRFVSVRRAEVANGTVNRQLQYLGRALRHMAKTYGAKVDAVKAQNDARFSEVLSEIRTIKPGASWQQMAGVVFAGITFIFAILAYASDRFDGGISAVAIKDQVSVEQAKRDASQDAKLDKIFDAVSKLQPTKLP